MFIIPISDDNSDRTITPYVNYLIILLCVIVFVFLQGLGNNNDFTLRFLKQVPAWVAVGLWFVFQLIGELGLLGDPTSGGGVAYAAHIGGFVMGLLLVKPFGIGRPEPVQRTWRSRY